MKELSLTILKDGVPVFTSIGKWLHPLFELEDYLAEHSLEPRNLVLQDKIIGKAAAPPPLQTSTLPCSSAATRCPPINSSLRSSR